VSKTLEYADTSAQTVKIGDTTTSFTMVLGEDSNPVDLTNATGIIAKLGNSTGYLKEQTVTSDNIPDPLSGQVIIKFDSDFMNGLPAGSYLLEVWVTYDSGVAIYPSGALTGFTINNNIESQSGSVITSISYDDFVKAMNKAASTIAKGDKGEKGDTGTVDNAGLTTAPAFVELKTQVNNSAFGTNLLSGTSGDLQTKQFTNNWNSGPQSTNGNYEIKLVKGQPYMYRVWLDNTNGLTDAFVNARFTPIGGSDSNLGNGTPVNKGETGYSTLLITPSADGYVLLIPFAHSSQQTYSAVWKEEKLEKGSVATDWCPNSSEILTQSDYAKIQAAIVALGGSL